MGFAGLERATPSIGGQTHYGINLCRLGSEQLTSELRGMSQGRLP